MQSGDLLVGRVQLLFQVLLLLVGFLQGKNENRTRNLLVISVLQGFNDAVKTADVRKMP